MIRKIFTVILFILSGTLGLKAQEVIFSQTFENTSKLFQGYVLANFDKATPIDAKYDTLRKVPWFVSTAGPAGNHAAIATSDYRGDTAANDWFVTPAIRLGEASTLSWKSLSITSGKTDTYEVYISTTEQSPAGCLFNGVAGSYVSSNATEFIPNELNLADAGYANQVVFIGFRLNTKSGGDKIAIDDIKVTENITHFVSLTFVVNMSKYIADSLFNPRTDTVDVAGNFNKFDGKKNILSIVPGTDSTKYSTTIAGFLNGDKLEFKFRINSSWNDTAVEFPYGQPNRTWTIENDKYTYTCYYNDKGSTFGVPENKLMNLVDVYPNPAQGMVWVGIPKSITKVSMVSLTGQKIIDHEKLSGSIVNFDVSSKARGTYILLFYTKDGFVGSKKLIKN